jgi:trimeric autotransporter adhesin
LFSTQRSLKVWTENPNFVADTVNIDDTINAIIRPALSGIYTIGGSNPDYNTITDAVAALNNSGICGPVTFNVDPLATASSLSSTLYIDNIVGTSPTNTITFNGNGHIISSSATPIIDFNGTKYCTLDSFNITGNSASYVGVGIHVGGGAQYLTIKRNTVTVSTTSTTATSNFAFASSGSTTAATTDGNNAQYLTITNNTFTGGYYSLTMIGQPSYLNNYGHYIANNTFKDFYLYGAYFNDADSVVFLENDINRATRATVSTLYGIYMAQCRYMRVQKNRIHDCGVSATSYYPIYLTNNVNSVGYETEISNNMIYNNPTTAIFYGIYSLTTAISNVKIYHNTIQHHVNSGTSAIRGAFFSVAITNVYFKNNIISITGAGTGIKTGIYVTTASTSFFSDNNVINVNTSASNNVGYWTAAQVSLANWRTASSQDINSVAADPLFSNLPLSNLKPTNILVDNIGVPVGITSDILGNVRSATKPDAGAIEAFPSVTNNASISEVILPKPLCSGLQNIKVHLVNTGMNIINSVYINWSINGIAQTPVYWTTPIDTFGSIAGNDTIITIGQYLFTSTPATIVSYTSLPNSQTDNYTADDSSQVEGKIGISGTYTIGAGGNYSNLTSAFADLGAQICGPVLFQLQSNYVSTGETFPLIIPASASPSDTIIIRPAVGASGLIISGNNVSSIIDLNAADYVTIDGRPGGVGTSELTIENTSTTGAVLRLINGATNNRLRFLNIKSNNATTTSGGILFGNVSSGIIGNSNNTISDCNLNGNSATVNCVYSNGSNFPADNQNNIISNCNIFDFFSNVAATDVSGITLAAGSSNWLITGNKFYQTAIRNSNSTPALTNAVNFRAILINNAAIGGCSITNNIIGGNISGITNSVFELGDATTTVGITARLIDNNVSSQTNPTSIQGNTIANINISSSVSNSFIGIHGRQGAVNIGTINGNTIGSSSGTGSIMMYYNGTSTNINIYAIRIEAASGFVSNNIIGSMSAETRSTGAQQLLSIYATGTLPGPLTISQNTVGGTTLHSLQSTSTSVGNCNVMGICVSGGTANLITINNNIVRNLSNLNSSSGTGNGVKGIYMTGVASVGTLTSNNTITRLYSLSTNPSVDQSSAVVGINNTNSSGSHTIKGNVIYGLHADASSSAVNVVACILNGTNTSQTNLVDGNRIYGLSANPLNGVAAIYGINMGTAITSGKYTLSNNMISLGRDTAGAALTKGHQLTGIFKQAGIASILHNTISIGGAGVDNTTNNSSAYRSLINSAGDSTMNNIFLNTRTNATAGGNHYTANLTNAINLISDYNLFYTTAAPLSVFNGVNQATLANWKSASSLDSHSVSLNVNLISHADLHLTGASIGNFSLAGIPLSSVKFDFDNTSRSLTYPYMGADENSAPLPVTLVYFKAVKSNEDVNLNWLTSSEVNNQYFEIQKSFDNESFESIGKVKGNGNSNVMNTYRFDDVNAFQSNISTLYYRLRQVNYDGSYELSKSVIVNNENDLNPAPTISPNPFSTSPVLSVKNQTAGAKAEIAVYNVIGDLVSTFHVELLVGQNEIELKDLNYLNKGVLIISITIGSEQTIQRLIKY